MKSFGAGAAIIVLSTTSIWAEPDSTQVDEIVDLKAQRTESNSPTDLPLPNGFLLIMTVIGGLLVLKGHRDV